MEATPTLNDDKAEDAASLVRKVCLGTTVNYLYCLLLEISKHAEKLDNKSNQSIKESRREASVADVETKILRAILQQLPNSELVKLSLVNKQWNYEARSVLRDRGTLIVKIKSTHKDLGAFASVLREMHVVPLAGMSIKLGHTCRSTYKGSLHPSYDVILRRLPFKKLSVDFCHYWDTCRDCPAFLLVKQILEECGGALEELSLRMSCEQYELLKQFILNCSFPSLKTLNLDVEDPEDTDFTKFVKALVFRLPNLQELHIQSQIHFNENVLEGSSAVLVPNPLFFNPLYERVCASLVPAVRPKTIEIQQKQNEDDDVNPYLLPDLDLVLNGHIPMTLHASRMTLLTLRVDLLFALPLMCYGICLEHVTTFQIYLDCSLLERLSPDILTLIKGFDFTRILPKLSQVKIDNHHYNGCPFSSTQVRAFVEQGKVVVRGTLPDRATYIKHLKFRGSVSDATVPFLAQMLPNVKTLSVTLGYGTQRIEFTLLWEHFKYLEELDVVHDGLPRSWGNLDSAFCGILPEEVAQLREMDDDYLKAVNIVPVMPSITCMKDLKKFTFRYSPEAYKLEKRDPTLIFSKVTGLIGFARCPHLAVAFESACANALHHMKPYGTLKVNIQMDDYSSDSS